MLGSSASRVDGTDRAQSPVEAVSEAIEALASIENWLPDALAGIGGAQLRERRDGLGPFSLLEQVWHLHDIDELGYLERVRRTLEEDRPRLPDVDGDRLAVERAYQDRPLQPAQDALLRRRHEAVARLRLLQRDDFRREAVLEGVGPVTLGDIVLRWSAHDAGHRVEIERLAEAVR